MKNKTFLNNLSINNKIAILLFSLLLFALSLIAQHQIRADFENDGKNKIVQLNNINSNCFEYIQEIQSLGLVFQNTARQGLLSATRQTEIQDNLKKILNKMDSAKFNSFGSDEVLRSISEEIASKLNIIKKDITKILSLQNAVAEATIYNGQDFVKYIERFNLQNEFKVQYETPEKMLSFFEGLKNKIHSIRFEGKLEFLSFIDKKIESILRTIEEVKVMPELESRVEFEFASLLKLSYEFKNKIEILYSEYEGTYLNAKYKLEKLFMIINFVSFIVLGIIIYIIYSSVIVPIQNLSRAALNMANLNISSSVPYLKNKDEIGYIANSIKTTLSYVQNANPPAKSRNVEGTNVAWDLQQKYQKILKIVERLDGIAVNNVNFQKSLKLIESIEYKIKHLDDAMEYILSPDNFTDLKRINDEICQSIRNVASDLKLSHFESGEANSLDNNGLSNMDLSKLTDISKDAEGSSRELQKKFRELKSIQVYLSRLFKGMREEVMQLSIYWNVGGYGNTHNVAEPEHLDEQLNLIKNEVEYVLKSCQDPKISS